MDSNMSHIRAIFRGIWMSVERIYYKRIKELEMDNNTLSREVLKLRKKVEELEK